MSACKLSQRALIIGDSPTLKINALAREMKQAGQPLIHLGGGEPVFPAPLAAVEAVISKAQTRCIRYTPCSGTAALKTAVAQYTQMHYNHSVGPTNILISAGAKQALYNFLLAVLNPADEVVFPAPYWVSYPEMVKLAGGTPVIVKPAHGLQVTFEELACAVTDKTKAILLNSPNNPSGLILEEDFIKKAIELAEQKNIFLFMDDIYHQLVFDGKKCPNPYSFSHHSQNLVIGNGVSKLYGLTGLRIGWAVSDNTDLIAAMSRMQAQTTSCNCDLSEAAATAALLADQQCVQDLRALLEKNRNVLLEQLSQIDHVQVYKPQGTFYSFANFGHYGADSEKLAQYLLQQALVAVVPGSAFGMDGYLRISFCNTEEQIVQGIQRIATALKNLS